MSKFTKPKTANAYRMMLQLHRTDQKNNCGQCIFFKAHQNNASSFTCTKTKLTAADTNWLATWVACGAFELDPVFGKEGKK